MDTRQILTEVRDALELAQKATGLNPSSIIEELEGESEHAMKVIQNLIDGMARQRRLWFTNDMTSKLENQEYQFSGKYSRERFAEIKAVFDAFAKWVEQPIVVAYADSESGAPEISIPPIVIVSRRENPPVGWGFTKNTPETSLEPEEVI